MWNRTYRYRSFFWPAVLILAGVIALLVNTGKLPIERLGLLVALWPLILIVIGLELIVRRNLHGVAGDVAAALIVLLAVAGAAGYVIVAPNPAQTHTLNASADVGSAHEVKLSIDAGAANMTIGGTTDKLYTARVEYSGQQPKVEYDPDNAVLHIDQSSQGFQPFQDYRLTLDLKLNTSVLWSIEQNTRAATVKMDLSNVRVAGISINTGASTADLTLGPTSQVVPVEFNGGALTTHVHRPAGTPVKVEVSGGFVNLVADGHSYHAVGSASYQTSFDSSGYDIKVSGGACSVTVDTAGESG